MKSPRQIKEYFFLTAMTFCFISSVSGQTDVNKVVETLSDNYLKAVGKPETGDFNKDGFQDIATIVVPDLKPEYGGFQPIKDRGIKVEYLCLPSQNCCDEIDFDSPALLIIHGKSKSKINFQKTVFNLKSAVLLRGRANVFAFQKKNVPDNLSFDVKNTATGSWIEFATEASEGIVKWQAGKYTWRETEP